MIPRLYVSRVKEKLRRYPAACLLGPRQCGKTTLAQGLGGAYFDLEAAGSETRLDAEWDSLMSSDKLIILDEAQHSPKLFPRLRGAIDVDRKRNGRFLLLGSVSPALMRNISESLAGRLGLVIMSPFILGEVGVRKLDDLWLYGGYPDGGILNRTAFPEWQQDYLDILVTRDLPNWGLSANPQLLLRLLHMLAAAHGQALNASQLGASLSLDHKTVYKYIDFLEGAYLIRRLTPYLANVGKRLTKTPRVYWRDSGILHSLMGVANRDHLYKQPWVGASWEGFVIEQTLATLSASGWHGRAFFMKTSDGHELDLVLDHGGDLTAVEIKLTSNPSLEDTARLDKCAGIIGAKRRVLICRISREIKNKSFLVTDIAGWLERLPKWL